VAQAPPKPNPRQAEGRKSLPVLANCQLPIADCSIFKELSLLHPGALPECSYFLRPYK
jgi:hypothetical protein